jgi:IS605 OrfB family transposase
MDIKKPPDKNLKTITFYDKNPSNNKVYDFMTNFSKVVYNKTLFCYNIYKYFENDIYKEVYNMIISNKKYRKCLPNNFYETKTENIPEINNLIYSIYNKKYEFYSDNYLLIKTNNEIIYCYISNLLKDTILDNSNFYQLRKKIINEIKNDRLIEFTESNYKLVFLDIVDKILLSYYNRVFYTSKYEMLNNRPFTYKITETHINEIKKNNHIIYKKTNNLYPKMLISQFKIKINEQNIIRKVTYDNLENKKILPSQVITDIIVKVYDGIKSYYALRVKGIKANKPKFLNKDDKYVLEFSTNSFKEIKDNQNKKIRLTVGDNVTKEIKAILGKNNLEITKNNYYYDKNKVINYKKSNNHIKLDNNKYIHNINLIDHYYLYFNIPKKIINKKIKLIEIVPKNDNYKICIIYEDDNNKIDKLEIINEINESISIDLGIKNLMTIYNPTGDQKIIKGGEILYINKNYDRIQSRLQSSNNKCNNKNKSKRMYNISQERENKINGYINNLVNKLINEYKDKNQFIIGYNKGWKNKVDLGSKTNRKFYQVPFSKIIKKLKEKMVKCRKTIKIINESYTSKCDSLSLEEICKHDQYMGNRIKRGLFESKIGKLINADLNGAINIMRKVINMEEIKGESLCNPKILKINQ